jgi:hypothetical protein
MIFAWTAIFAVLIAAGIMLVLGLLALASVFVPPGKIRTVLQIVLALLGLIAATLLAWD